MNQGLLALLPIIAHFREACMMTREGSVDACVVERGAFVHAYTRVHVRVRMYGCMSAGANVN